MAVQVTTIAGVTFNIPEAGDPNWGQEMTSFLVYISQALLNGDLIVATEITTPPQSVAALDGLTLDTTNASCISLAATAPVTLNATTPLLPPVAGRDGKRLLLIGTSSTNTVTVPDSGNVNINGPWTGGLDDTLDLIWVDSRSKWLEVSRNN